MYKGFTIAVFCSTPTVLTPSTRLVTSVTVLTTRCVSFRLPTLTEPSRTHWVPGRSGSHGFVWAVGLAFFGLSSAAEAWGSASGWTVGLYRWWYLSGAICVAAYLGAGSLYLNSSRLVHWLTVAFVASGCLCWDQPKDHPQTFGWQPDYTVEGKILGQWIADKYKGKKVAYFVQNDDFGADGVKGLDMYVPKNQVVTRQTYEPGNTDIGPQMATIKIANQFFSDW